MHKQGGWDGQYLSYNVCSLALVSQGKATMIGVTLDSPSDSWVPTHGATSVPSMPAFSGNPILPTRSRQDILENPKAPTFQHETRLEIVAPDQVQIRWRQSLRHKENIDINFAAEFATHEEMLRKFDSFYLYMSSDCAKNGKNGISAMPRSILRFLI